MELKIKSIKIENFKGIKSFNKDFECKNVIIRGDNRTGKTTIVDAYNWLLFGKDSLGQANFDIKPLKKDGSVRHNLETVVEIIFIKDDKELILKKVYREIWKGKRGLGEELTGHETLCYINEEKVGVNQYNNFIKDLVDEEIFKTLSNTRYFNNLHHSNQREILFNLVEDVSEVELIKTDKKFNLLKEHLIDRNIDTLINVLKERNKQANRDLEEFPYRIQALADVNYDLPNDYSEKDNLVEIKKLDDEKNRLEELQKNNAPDYKRYNQMINDLEIKKREVYKLIEADLEKQNNLLANEKRRLENERLKISASLDNLKNDLFSEEQKENRFKTELKEKEELKQKLIAEYKEIDKREFTADFCVYCKQPLPADEVAKAKEVFNVEKSNQLEANAKKGKSLIDEIKKLEDDLDQAKKRMIYLNDRIQVLDEELIKAEEELKNHTEKYIPVKDEKLVADYEKLEKSINVLDEEMNKQQEKSEFREEISKILLAIDKLKEYSVLYKLKLDNEKKINKLEEEQKELKAKWENNLILLTLCEDLLVKKREILTDKINSHFELVQFKLFEELLNGGIREICVATINGVPYASLNNAGRINAGLDIIKTLQDLYKKKVPVFIDNAESITAPLQLNSQVIKMYVDVNFKSLFFEIDKTIKNKEKENEKNDS